MCINFYTNIQEVKQNSRKLFIYNENKRDNFTNILTKLTFFMKIKFLTPRKKLWMCIEKAIRILNIIYNKNYKVILNQ